MIGALLRHLRFPFSLNLMPVFGFAVAFTPLGNPASVALLFGVLHLLVYPSSNGYNSLMDRDEGSIGGLEHPPPVPAAMARVTAGMDALALLLTALWISPGVLALLAAYILFSRLYSHRAIRLKRYPVIGFFTVALFQGPAVYAMTVLAATGSGEGLAAAATGADGLSGWLGSGGLDRLRGGLTGGAMLSGLAVSFLLIASGYPLTQVYQHRQDALDGVRTLSMRLGVKGTFRFCTAMFGLLTALLVRHAVLHGSGWTDAGVLLVGLAPVGWVFMRWMRQVFDDPSEADFRNTMRLNRVAAISLNVVFLALLGARMG